MPLFFPLAPWLGGPAGRPPAAPDCAAVARQAEALALLTESGQRLRFVPPQDDGLAYERRVWERGEVETRPDNWHDYFNALVWFAFPRAKAALNARHMREMAPLDPARGAARDAMTHFDECGIVVTASDPALLDLLRGFAWKELFWARRAEVMAGMGFFVFGHATYEQLLAPFRGITAKAVLYEVAPGWHAQPLDCKLADLDGRLAADLAAGRYGSPRDLQPLPLLGIPGVTPANVRADYYDDTWQFRPGRRAVGV